MGKEGDLRIKVYKDLNRGIIKFYKDTLPCFNFGPYVKLWGKGRRLYFLPSTPSAGMLIGAKDTIQTSNVDMLGALQRYQGTHKMLFDDTTHYYYIEPGAAPAEEETSNQEAPKDVRALVKVKHQRKDDVQVLLRNMVDECIDNDDLAGAKALLKAVRAIEAQEKGA